MSTCTSGPALPLLLCGVLPVFAQQASPEDVAREHFAAMQAEGMGAVVDFMHPDALAEFKRTLMPLFEAAERGGNSMARDVVFGQMTLAQVRALDTAEFMRSFTAFMMAQRDDIELSFDKIEIVGVVPEGERRHVLARITVGANELVSLTQFEVLSFVPFEDTWRLELTGELRSLAESLRSALGEKLR
jgi:hypothetical protein